MDISLVLDLGFGDSGKGITVDYFARQNPSDTLVVRFSGGHQVGHTVRHNTLTHTFSHFGAGTLRGVPTYYTHHTTIFPPAMLAELAVLRGYPTEHNITPTLYLHPLVMVTCPFDIAYNRARESLKQHGSCGVGFGACIDRHSAGITLYAQDLQHPWVLEQKLLAIRDYYLNKTEDLNTTQSDAFQTAFMQEIDGLDVQPFIDQCLLAAEHYQFIDFPSLAKRFGHLIFEGSQGIMLDQLHGIYPHLTRSHTTAKNALDFLDETQLDYSSITAYYVTRCYQTRHGNGPMSSHQPVSLIHNEHEANIKNRYQGDFRTAQLDPSLLRYALQCDKVYHGNKTIHPALVVTCLDQRPSFCVADLLSELAWPWVEVYGSYSPDSKDFKLLT